jgi:hypothetical protein
MRIIRKIDNLLVRRSHSRTSEKELPWFYPYLARAAIGMQFFEFYFPCRAVLSTALKPATFQVTACFSVALPSTSTSDMPKPVAVQGWAIMRFQSRSERWTSWQEAGAERDRRRRSDIKRPPHASKLFGKICKTRLVKRPNGISRMRKVFCTRSTRLCSGGTLTTPHVNPQRYVPVHTRT